MPDDKHQAEEKEPNRRHMVWRSFDHATNPRTWLLVDRIHLVQDQKGQLTVSSTHNGWID
eukprot:11288111-Prorocentrum_lima.AAC.1